MKGKTRVELSKDKNGYQGVLISAIDENETKSIANKMTNKHMQEFYKALQSNQGKLMAENSSKNLIFNSHPFSNYKPQPDAKTFHLMNF